MVGLQPNHDPYPSRVNEQLNQNFNLADKFETIDWCP